MTIYSKLEISGTEVVDTYEYEVEKSMSEDNSSSNFKAYLDNREGRNNDVYSVGQEVIVYDGSAYPPTATRFTGILENIEFEGKDQERMILTGRDYTARMMDRTVEPEVYTNLEAGSIVKDVMAKYTNDITTTNVSTTITTIPKISFGHVPVYDAVKQLADLSASIFYVDTSKDLHFEAKSSGTSGKTFDSGNIWQSHFKEQRDTVFNQIWVYGDRYLDGFKETFTAGSPLGGSIFTLLYNPHNTEITVSGAVIQPGAVKEMTLTPGSNIKYLVDYDLKQIIFTSGTNQGANIPTSGNSVVVNYKRALPIVKVGDNETSKAKYGTRVKVIVNKDIKDPQTAEDILAKEIELNGEPKKEGTINVRGVIDVIPGQTCVVNLPWEDIDNQTCDIINARYSYNKENNLSEKVLEVIVNNKLPDITDTLKEIINNLKKLQAEDINPADFITRYQYTTGSVGLRMSGAVISSIDINDSFIAGHPVNSIAGTTLLGDRRSAAVIVWSGGY